MDEEQQEFEVVMTHSMTQSMRQEPLFATELQACFQIQQNLVQDSLRSTIDDIAGQCHDEFENGVSSQIFTVQFRKNQQGQFGAFSQQLQQKFRQESGSIFDLPPQRVEVLLLQKSQVRQIVLHMYIYLQEHPQSQMAVFIVSAISDLDQRNLYCFQKGLKGKRFVVVLPTFSSFESKHQTGQNFQKYHYKLYNSRDLFCKYLFNCLANDVIRPYLPPEVLSLISDIDYYSISFRESCRRFAYCLQRFLMLSQRQRNFVQFSELVLLVDSAISDRFTFYPGVKNAHEKMLKVILDQKEIYTVSQKAIGYQIAFANGVGREALQQSDIIRQIRQTLRRQLARHARFAAYAEWLVEREQSRETVARKKRSRADQLGIDTKKNITPKNTLQNQITRIIKDATAGIRQQAAHIRWEDIKFQMRIKPQLPLLIRQAWGNDGETAQLLEEVGSNYSAPISKYLKMFEDDLGRGIYLIRCLQLAGLVEVSKKHQPRPILYNNFFQKCKFSGKQEA